MYSNIRIFALAAFLLSIIAVPAAHAAGFDCTKAATPAEKLICSDNKLSAMDSQLSDLYAALTQGAYKRAGLVADQRLWLKTVRDSCDTVSCLHNAYQERVQYLESLSKPVQLATCTLPKPPAPDKGCERRLVCAENVDHSFFQAAADVCTKAGAVSHSIDIYRHADKSATPVRIRYVADVDGFQDLSWDELDRNGNAELDILLTCGAGPNCGHQLMRFDPDSNSMYDYFNGGYSDLSYFDGYLLEHGRGGFNEWEFHAHKMHLEGKRDIVENKIFVIEFDGADEENQTCRYFEYYSNDSKTRPIKPPSDKWYRRFCPKDGKLR
jgi:uncharacterized protein